MVTSRETRRAHAGFLFVPVWAALANEENEKENKNMFFLSSFRDVGENGDPGHNGHHWDKHKGVRGYHETGSFVSAFRTKKESQSS